MINFSFKVTTGEETVVEFPAELGGGYCQLSPSGKPGESPLTAVKAVLYGDERKNYEGHYSKRAFWRQFGAVPTNSGMLTVVVVPADRLFAYATPLLSPERKNSNGSVGSFWGDWGKELPVISQTSEKSLERALEEV